VLIALLACAPGDSGDVRRSGTEETAPDSASTDSAGTDTGVIDDGPCPPEMALAGETCVDRWEAGIADWSPYDVPSGGTATAASGAVPQGYISGDVAALACAGAGKRLCSLSEWMRACGGPDGTLYPYGDTHDADACNDSYGGSHPVVDYFGTAEGVWDRAHMNDPGINQQPGTLDPSGASPSCVTPEGIFDLHGNLHEWIADGDGTFKGGFYGDAAINGPGCTYTTTAHSTDYHDYSTGFRCCMAPR
jgi:sulfatase modifying factor 1